MNISDFIDKPRLNASQRIFSPTVKKEVYKAWDNRCRFCHSELDLQIDHIIPVALGGTNEPDNLMLLCRACNLKKRHLPMLQWAEDALRAEARVRNVNLRVTDGGVSCHVDTLNLKTLTKLTDIKEVEYLSPREGDMKTRFLKLVIQLEPGEYSVSTLVSRLNFDETTAAKLKRHLKEPTTSLRTRLSALGMNVLVKGKGRGAQTFIFRPYELSRAA